MQQDAIIPYSRHVPEPRESEAVKSGKRASPRSKDDTHKQVRLKEDSNIHSGHGPRDIPPGKAQHALSKSEDAFNEQDEKAGKGKEPQIEYTTYKGIAAVKKTVHRPSTSKGVADDWRTEVNFLKQLNHVRFLRMVKVVKLTIYRNTSSSISTNNQSAYLTKVLRKSQIDPNVVKPSRIRKNDFLSPT